MTRVQSPRHVAAAATSSDLDPLSLIDPGCADALLARPGSQDPSSSRKTTHGPLQSEPSGMAANRAGVCDLLAMFASGDASPAGIIDELAASIKSCETGREAVLCILETHQAAAESSRRWKDGTARPLEGLPFGIKDIVDVAGAPVTSGSLLTGQRIARDDAAVVASLRAAGAIPFAMLATTEFAAGSPFNPRYGAVANPWDRSRWTGGSSTGSGAALAARLMPLALGTDTGGSIRVPSCWCGTTGLKPTRDLVPRRGVSPLSWTLDHVGPMACSARDIMAVLPFMTGVAEPGIENAARRLLETEGDLSGLRIGVGGGWFTDSVDAGVLSNWRAALGVLEAAGAGLVDLPDLAIAQWHAAGWVVLTSELATLQDPQMDRAHLFDAGLRSRIETGRSHGAIAYGKALQARAAAQRAFLAAMEGLDAILTPGLGGEAGVLDGLTVDVDGTALPFQDVISRNTMIFDLLGFPALMMPSGLGRSDLPTGVQIAARPHDDLLCLRIAAAFQEKTGHHLLSPVLRARPV